MRINKPAAWGALVLTALITPSADASAQQLDTRTPATTSSPAEELHASASFVGQSIPTTVQPETILSLTVEFRNTGSTTWDSSYLMRIRGHAWETLRARLSEGEAVPPGSSKKFTFSVTAPREPGRYAIQCQMATRHRPFGESSPLTNVVVEVSSGENGAKFVSQIVTSRMVKGVAYPTSITMKNTGKTTWTARDGYGLDSRTASEKKSVRVALDPADSIAPGSVKTFSFMLKGPENGARLHWRMSQEGKQSFGDETPTVRNRAPRFAGTLDIADCREISGWSADKADLKGSLRVAILADGVQIALVTANLFRPDLKEAHIGRGSFGFDLATPEILRDGQPHLISAVIVPSGGVPLNGSAKSITCAAPSKRRPH